MINTQIPHSIFVLQHSAILFVKNTRDFNLNLCRISGTYVKENGRKICQHKCVIKRIKEEIYLAFDLSN